MSKYTDLLNHVDTNGYFVTVFTGVEEYGNEEQYVGHILLHDNPDDVERSVAIQRVERVLTPSEMEITYHEVRCALPDDVVQKIQRDAIRAYKARSFCGSD